MCETKSKKELVDIILGWSIDDILNQNLLKHKVNLIPTEFLSVNHYLESFRYPLVEELRGELWTQLLAVSEAPYVGIILNSAGLTNCGDAIFSFSLYCEEQRAMYEPRIGDVVLLSTFMPKDVEDLQNCISLGVVTKRSGDGRHCEGKLGTSTRKKLGGGALHFAVYLTSITNISNVWNSLNVDIDDPHINLNLIRKALCRQSLVNKSNTATSSQVEDILLEEVTSKLNESQIDAVRSVVCDMTSNHSESMHCISGLPGTGKSEIACIIALAALSLRLKVIICLPSNYLVGDIAAHFDRIVEGSHVKCNKEDIAVYGDSDAEQLNSYSEHCLKSSRLIFCSLSWLLSMKKIASVGVLIIDNAFEMKECDTIIQFQLKGLRHVILIGNAYSLPAPTKSKISEDVGFARSLFERLGSYCPPRKLLDIQYRMHPEISSFPSTRFFNGLLFNAPNMDSSHFRRLLPEHIYEAYSFVDVADGKETMNDHINDERNVVEAAVVVKILTKLYHAHKRFGGKLSIGVLSPYKAQVQTIQDMLSERFESNSEFSVWVRSFDGIRSDEVDVIIISTVRCSGSVSFISDQYITSLSLTRARQCLWIVGSRTALVKSRSIWQDLVHDAGKRGCLFHVGEDKDLAKVVLDIKHELDELNDLLDMESVLFHDKKWKVIFSDDFKQSFVALKSLFIKQIVLGFLLRLASGWRPKRRCVYSLKPSVLKFVKLYRVHGMYLVCTIDIANDAEYTQVLKIWDVVPLVEIPKHVAKLEEMISLCSDYYMERCMKEKHEGNLVVPMSWNLCSDFIKYNYPPSSPGHCSGSGKSINLERSKVSESLLLMKFYSLSSGSVQSLLKACNGKEIELPFEVNDVELEIIRYPRSSFILGRSGTGKTIISIMKLMQREQVNIEAVHGVIPNTHHNKMLKNHALAGNSLRQIFVTVSANLCSVVRDYITRLRRCVSGLDIQGDTNVNEMSEVGDWLSIFSDIPDSFIDIPERHFPLVISLHKFLLMLDGSLSCSYFDRFRDILTISDGKGSTMSRGKQQLILGKEVRFQKFLTSYWPSFNARYTSKLDPQLVFSQIISFIKGGCRLGKADWKEKLDEEAYVRLLESRKSTITISENKRHMIYQIFMNYEKKKRQNGEYDISDLVLHIHSRLRHEGYSGAMLDFVYIDEVQDFTVNQLLLFKYVCANVKEGFVFSGDTAQTITRGVDFRFQDIRSLFYTDFLVRSERSPVFFKLKQNFRTHAAILKLGQSVLSLLYHFFPLSVDELESETSLLQGEVPVLLNTCDDNVLKNIFCSNVNVGDNKLGTITFGAQQVILVRDDLVKKQVIEQVGNNALVLTIIECKGLEFQDVLLYNCFEKSSLRVTWEVVYDFMAGKNLWDPLSHRYPLFDEDRDSALCGELKELYVAITRPRERLWIFERTGSAEPLFAYWKKLGVVNQGEFDISFAGSMQSSCKHEEWNLRGQKFFNEGDYETASFCFKRSGDVYRWKWAKAASLQLEGQNKWHTDLGRAITCLSEAAEKYEDIGKLESAATCFMKLGNFAKASSIYLEKFDRPRFEEAGDCFKLARCWDDAAKTYAQGKCLSKCLSACEKGDLYELGWELMKEWPEIVARDSKVIFLKSWISRINKLSDIKSVIKFANAFPEDAYRILLEKENYVEASILQRARGNTLIEADLLERAAEYQKSTQCVVFHIMVQIFSTDGRDGMSLQPSQFIKKLVKKAEELAYKVSNSYGEEVHAELDFLTDQSCTLPNVVAHVKKAPKFRNVMVEIYGSRKMLETYLKVDVGRYGHDEDEFFKRRSWPLDLVISEGFVSAQVLISALNMWKQRISRLYSFLQGTVNASQNKSYKAIYYKFFGVLKINSQDNYVAFNNKLLLLKGSNEEVFHRIDNKVYLSGSTLRTLGQQFLAEEICFLCDEILNILMECQKNYQEKRLFFVQRAVLGLQICGILKFLSEYGYRHYCIPEGLMGMAFSPLYFTESMIVTRNDADLQEKDTAIQAVGIVLHANLKSFKSGSTPTKIGWSIVFLFLSNKLIEELTWETRNKSGSHYSWKKFSEEFLNYKNEGFRNASPLAHAFLDSLQPFDPHSQVLLIECLLFLTSSCQIGRGWFMTTKLMVSKAVYSEDSESFQYALSGSSEQADVSQSFKQLYDFILAVVSEIMSKQRFVWTKRYKTEILYTHQSLAVRLVSILGLICLNSEEHFYQVQDVLRDAAGILLVLPPRFQLGLLNVMKGHMKSYKIFARLFTKALETIDNRLVLFQNDGIGKSFTYLKPKVINSGFFSQRKEIQSD